MDEMDILQDLETARNEQILAERRQRAKIEENTIPPTSRECESCGCDIPAKRLALKPLTRLCVDCQAELEERR